jgi:hypothetical protein
MKYVAIVTTYKDIPASERTEDQLAFPDYKPAYCEEFESEAAARAKYPESLVLSAEAYAGYALAVDTMLAAGETEAAASLWRKLWPF